MNPIAGSSQRGVVGERRGEDGMREEERRRAAAVEEGRKVGRIRAGCMAAAGRRGHRRVAGEEVVEDGRRSRSRERLVGGC